MKTGEIFHCIIVVAWDGNSIMYDAPKPVLDMMYGSAFLEDSSFHNVPTEQGIYQCQVRFEWDEDGLDEEAKEDVDDYHFLIRDVVKLDNRGEHHEIPDDNEGEWRIEG